ncbi:MAG: hypothetical protein AAF583_10170 [Pseudomonadota bacterium]
MQNLRFAFFAWLSSFLGFALASCASISTPIAEGDDIAPGGFDVEKDFLLVNYDFRPDPDDLHAVAGLHTIITSAAYSSIRYHAVAGADGHQPFYHPYVGSNELMELAFGTNWSDAKSDWNGAVDRVSVILLGELDAGADIWIADAGQHDFSHDVVAQILEVRPDLDTRQRIKVVQHSDWNREQSRLNKTNQLISWVNYQKISDGNEPLNGTPDFENEEFTDWQSAVTNPENAVVWELAVATGLKEMKRPITGSRINPGMLNGSLDFSDMVEVCWMLGFTDVEMPGIEEFFEVMSSIDE